MNTKEIIKEAIMTYAICLSNESFIIMNPDQKVDFIAHINPKLKQANETVETTASDICHGVTDCISVGDEVSFPIRVSGNVKKVDGDKCLVYKEGTTYLCETADLSII